MNSLFEHIAFLGNLHPIVVHFPLALLPIALVMKLSKQPAIYLVSGLLLKLVLIFAILAALLGTINVQANGFTSTLVDSHASYAWATISVLLLAILLPDSMEDAVILRKIIAFTKFMLSGLWFLVRKLFFLLMCILFPIYFLFLLIRKLYRVLLSRLLDPLVKSVWGFIKKIFLRIYEVVLGFVTLVKIKNTALVACLVLVVVTGYKGSNLVHGKGHLTRHAPDWVLSIVALMATENNTENLDQVFFETNVLPVFRKNCVKCHGEDKAKGGLRLHDFEHVMASGVVESNSPFTSELLKRVILSRSDPAAMPPVKNGKALRSTDIALLIDWINGESVGGVTGSFSAGLPYWYEEIAPDLGELSNADVVALNKYGATAKRIKEGENLLRLNLQFVEEVDMLALLPVLDPLLDHIVELDISGRKINGVMLNAIADMDNLVKLNISSTQIDDSQFHQLKHLDRLRWLNLFNTRVTLEAINTLQVMESLQTLYIQSESISEEEMLKFSQWKSS